MSWDAVDGAVGYRVQWKLATASSYSTTGDSHTAPADAVSYRIGNLSAGTAYDVTVTARVAELFAALTGREGVTVV